jgi:hypothetical protein
MTRDRFGRDVAGRLTPLVDVDAVGGKFRVPDPVQQPATRRPMSIELFERLASGDVYVVSFSDGADELMHEPEAKLLAEANRIPWRSR